MANKVSNPYIELYEQLSVPERLEPKNIAAMLESVKAAGAMPEKTSVKPAKKIAFSHNPAPEVSHEEISSEPSITRSNKSRKTTVAYRSIASIAACAALALGIFGYMNVGRPEIKTENNPGGGTYASDYDDVHKTFEKYYVGDSDKKTLDSALKEIEHSYNESENANGQGVNVPETRPETKPETPEVSTPEPVEPAAPSTESSVDNPAPSQTEPEPEPDDQPEVLPPEPPAEIVDEDVPLPLNPSETDFSDILFGDGFILLKDNNIIRIITSSGNGDIVYTDNIFPSYTGTVKTLSGFFCEGSRVVAVYSSAGALDGVYGASPRNEVEVCTYDVYGGRATLLSTVVQDGTLIDMNFVNGSIYLVTAYSDDRSEPIIGVDDLNSYVPGYTVNGQRYYVSAPDIMIPDYLSTTDYTVISGINTSSGEVSVKAVLGYEGRVILKNGAVYLFSYDSSAGVDLTSVRVFSVSGGNVAYAGFVNIDGVALGGDGISVFGNYIAVTAIRKSEDRYVTSLGVYDGTMNRFSGADISGVALTNIKREGNSLCLSGADGSWVIDLSDLANPSVREGSLYKDESDGLTEFMDGYVTLTKAADGSICLARIFKDMKGELRLDYKTTVTAEDGARSTALSNNGILFISGDVVGVPYGFFDGYDYTYRYALYRAVDSGFELMGEIETHEVDDVFEYDRAILKNGVLYVLSEGRISSVIVSSSIIRVGSADIVESSYSGH